MKKDSGEDLLKTGGAFDVLSEVSADEQFVGRDLGDYRVTGLIAEGGMSRVYRAERIDGSFEREVAIKISPVGGFNEQMRERFLMEQSVLAGLNHPNISQLYDAQVTKEGWPYIVMELVDGGPIDQFCISGNKTTEERVRQLIDVVDAVAFAHARLVVHRDIKPSNVLVDGEGRPKLLDFGIAKLLKGDTSDLTKMSPMTPRYASPEQLLGQPITVASDVYQLGLLMLEVLAETSANRQEAVSEAIQRAADQRPIQIDATVKGKLPRELLLIIEQCLRVSPEDRYRDANSLRSDLQAYLDGYPVSAAGQRAGYRFRKFIGRNAAATAIAVVALAASIGGSAWYTWQLAQARDLAERRATTANRVLQTMSGLVADTFSGLVDTNAERNAGDESYVERILGETVRFIDAELEAEPEARAELLRVQGTIEMVLGNYEQSASVLKDAYDLVDPRVQPDTSVEIMLERVEIASRAMDFETARSMLDEAQDLIRQFTFDDGLMALFHHQSGQVLQFEGEYEAAIAEFAEAIAYLERQDPVNTLLLASTYEEIAFTHTNWNKYAECIEAADRAVQILEETESPMSHRLIHPLRFGAYGRIMTGRLNEGRVLYERALAIANANFGAVHPDVAAMQDSMGALAYREGRVGDAVQHFEEMIRIVTIMDGADAPNLIVPLANAALMYTDLGEMNKAGEYFERILDQTAGREPENLHFRFVAATNDGRRLEAIGNYSTAVSRYREAADLAGQLFRDNDLEPVRQESHLARALARNGDLEEARQLFDASAQRYGEIRGFGEEGHTLFSSSDWYLDWLSGDVESARQKLERFSADKIERDDIDVIYAVGHFADLATVCMAQGDLGCAKQSIEYGKRGAATSPAHPWALFIQVVEAEYLFRTNQRDRARVLARSALTEIESRFPTRTEDIRRARAIIDS